MATLPIELVVAKRRNRERATFRRSLSLFHAFGKEQTDPELFYSLLAADSVEQLAAFVPLARMVVLDVGGGPGYFADAFRDAGATYYAVDDNLGELSARTKPGAGTVMGSGMALPIADNAVDICYSSNVLEHVPEPETMANEMLRVTRPGGTVFLSYTTWLSPHGGHETAPWHYLGGARAAHRYLQRVGHEPKNYYGRTLFPISAGAMLRWADRVRAAGLADVVDVFPRYHPSWAHWITQVPGVREVAMWNVAIVLRRR